MSSCAAVDPATRTAPRLLNRDFVLLWQGQLVSQVGNQAFLVAQMFWLMEATGSASLMGLLLMSSSLPGILLGPVAGTLADRHSRKALIMLADLARGIAVLGLAALLYARPEQTGAIVVMLFGVALWSGVFGAIFNPAITAAIPDLVPAARLQAANSLHQLSGLGATFLGQGVGGIAFRLLGAPLLFLVDGASYVVSAASEGFIRLPGPERGGAGVPGGASTDRSDSPAGTGSRQPFRSYVADTVEGFRYVWSWTGMRTFILTATGVNFLFMPVFVLLPFYVTDVLQRRADWYGFLLASMSLGSLVGLATAGSLRSQRSNRARLLTMAFIGAAGLIAVLGVVRRPFVALVVVFAMGVLSAMINIFVLTLLQLSTPARMRGRVMGLVLTLAGAATPLGMATGGIVADLTGRQVPATYVTLGLLATALVVLSATRDSFWEFLATDAASPTDLDETAM
jgi:MFS family permease